MAQQYQVTGDAPQLYERYLVPYHFEPWAHDLVQQAALRPGESVLDVACGTGIVARIAAEMVGTSGKVTGLDLNPGMLAVARSLKLPQGTPAITWVECSAVSMILEDESFDVVLCQQGLQFFPDRPAALREMRRVLAPEGRLVLTVWKKPSVLHLALGDALERHAGIEVANKSRASRTVPPAEEIHRLVVEAGFREVQVHSRVMTTRFPLPEEYVPLHMVSTPLATDFAGMDEATRNALVQDVSRSLESYVEENELVFPDEVNITMAIK